MKRKLLALLTAMLLMVTMVTPAFADIIWEPYGDNFYEKHRDECSYHDRCYLANGEKGYVTVKTSPDSLGDVTNIANGTRFFVVHLWTGKDGAQWGVGYPAGEFDSVGWVKLSEMAMVYDHISFEEDHSHEFGEYDGSGDDLGKALVFSYPGGTVKSTLEENAGYMPFAESFHNLYTDENGLRWTYVGYYMGHRDGWVCVDDPMNEALASETYLTVDRVRGGAADIVPPVAEVPVTGVFPLWLIPVVLVIAVAAFTAVIVRKRNGRAG